MKKPFKTYEEQILVLQGKGLLIPDIERAIQLLKSHSYYGLISGYKKPFKDKNSLYKKNTTINDIYSLYKFDDKMRFILLKYIMIVEKNFKSLISYYFCEKYGCEESHYLDVNSYSSDVKLQNQIIIMVSKLSKVLDDANQFDYMMHQKLN